MSRFRGVYKCGKRWKAQLQSQGVQFYLGSFESEIEAARAYDLKAFEEKGDKALTNFDHEGNETDIYSKPFSSCISYYDDDNRSNKRLRAESISFDSTSLILLENAWGKLCEISSRLDIAYATRSKLLDLAMTAEKDDLVKSVNDEISLLTIVKESIENTLASSVKNCVSRQFVNESGVVFDSNSLQM